MPILTTSSHYDVEEPASLNPSAFPPERNLLYRNNGDGTFTEVAVQAGVPGRKGRSLEAVWADFDQDGWPDLYIANDVSDNVLYHNEGDGTFSDISHAARVADYRGAMGIAVGDWDGDSDMDMVVTHWMAQENALYSNRHLRRSRGGFDGGVLLAPRFRDEADRFGLGQIALDYIGFGTSFFDYDNDGRLDLLVANGSTLQQREDPRLLIPMPDQLFWNRGPDEGFYDVSSVSGEYFQREYGGRGVAFGDYDNDGDVDVFIVNNGGPGILLRNDGGNRNRWLQVRLEGRQSNRSAFGARLRLVAGGAVQVREVGSQGSYLSQNSLTEHFGLADAQKADTLEILWPSGSSQVLVDVAADQVLHVVEGEEPAKTAGGTDREQVLRFWELYREATDHRVAGRTREAASTYESALELKDDHEDALYYLGNMYVELDEHAVGGARRGDASWRSAVRARAPTPGSATSTDARSWTSSSTSMRRKRSSVGLWTSTGRTSPPCCSSVRSPSFERRHPEGPGLFRCRVGLQRVERGRPLLQGLHRMEGEARPSGRNESFVAGRQPGPARRARRRDVAGRRHARWVGAAGRLPHRFVLGLRAHTDDLRSRRALRGGGRGGAELPPTRSIPR